MRSSLTMVRNALCALAIAPALFGSALTSPGFVTSARGDDRALPMRFELRIEGPAAQCGSSCRTFISASGALTADTPRDFKQFMQTAATRGQTLRDATVVLDSDGGSTLGAIALGREIRRTQLSTMVGRIVDVGEKSDIAGEPRRGRVSGVADCESMCAFVMLGGVKRSVPAEARVMVHQIWLGDRREDPTAATYSAEDLVLVQRDIGKLAIFTAEMGASIDLLDLALRIPPWEPLHVMSRDEIVRTKLATDSIDPASAPVAAAPPAPRPQQPVTDGAKANSVILPISDRSWALVNNDSGEVLARRHPLTVEGDRIGSFDLMLSCGASGKFDLSYVERRQGSGAIAVPKRLDDVRLRVGRAEAVLKVVSSAANDTGGELRSLAMGAVPAELVRKFAEGNRSIVVETTSGGMATVIRIGNTGAPQNVPRLASACGKPAGDRADAAMLQKTGGLASVK